MKINKKFVKKYLITISLLGCIFFAYIYRAYLNSRQEVSNVVVETEKEVKELETLKLDIYDPLENKVKEKEIEIKNKDFLTMGDYIKLVIKNSTFLTNKMQFLSVYELEDGQVLIVLSDEFSELSKSSSTLKFLLAGHRPYPNCGFSASCVAVPWFHLRRWWSCRAGQNRY